MSSHVSGTSIELTRGDTFKRTLVLTDAEGNPFTPTNNDVIRFALKRKVKDEVVLINKIIPNDTLLLKIDPEDTKNLPFGDYVYDIQLTYPNGDVDTFITVSKFKITEEVD